MDVNVVEGKTPLRRDFRAAMKPVQGQSRRLAHARRRAVHDERRSGGIVPPPGGDHRYAATSSLLDPAQNNSFQFINRALAQGATLRFAPASGGRGARYVADRRRRREGRRVGEGPLGHAPSAPRRSAPRPCGSPTRIATLQVAPGVMDEGWTEWLFDTYGVKYTLITPTDSAPAISASRFDVIVVGSQASAVAAAVADAAAAVAERGARRRWPAPDSSAAEEQSRGRRLRTRRRNRRRVESGRDVDRQRAAPAGAQRRRRTRRERNSSPAARSCRSITDRSAPGHGGHAGARRRLRLQQPGVHDDRRLRGRGARQVPGRRHRRCAQASSRTVRQYIQGYAAALDVKHVKGHAILFAFQPEWRGQPTGTFRTVFNARVLRPRGGGSGEGCAGLLDRAPLARRIADNRPPEKQADRSRSI